MTLFSWRSVALRFPVTQSCNQEWEMQLLIVSPVHDEAVGDDHFVQIVFIMPGDAKEVQSVSLLVIGNLEREGAVSSALRGKRSSMETQKMMWACQPPVYQHTKLQRHQNPSRRYRAPRAHGSRLSPPHPDKWTSYHSKSVPHLQIWSHGFFVFFSPAVLVSPSVTEGPPGSHAPELRAARFDYCGRHELLCCGGPAPSWRRCSVEV